MTPTPLWWRIRSEAAVSPVSSLSAMAHQNPPGSCLWPIPKESAELVVAKAGNLLQPNGQRSNSRGIQGSLQEMGLPDVLQVLSRFTIKKTRSTA